jgi:AGZA family xanthine/uracil permease-like MFS transporter
MEIKQTKFTTEIRAGLTTFFTMSYIIAVNVSGSKKKDCSCLMTQASILADTGGNCVCNTNDANDPFCFTNSEYSLCKQGMNTALIHRVKLNIP